jgi:hypothetical protein
MPQINEGTSVRLDSTFQPDPPEGWFGLGNSSGIESPILALDYFQTVPWFHIAFDSGTTSSDVDNLGSRNKAAGVGDPLGRISALAGEGGSNSSNTTLSPALSRTIDDAIGRIISNAINQSLGKGILGDIDPMLFLNVSVNKATYTIFINQTVNSTQSPRNTEFNFLNLTAAGLNLTTLQPLPWFNDTNLVSDEDLDDLISHDILTTVHQLTLINSSSVRLGYWSSALFQYPAVAKAIQIVGNMPWGILRFSHVENGSYAYMIQAGTDQRLLNVASYPPEGLRRMAFQTMFSKAMRMPPARCD